MSLNRFEFKASYNKADNNIAEEFYLPCMSSSVKYDRISGFFSSTIYYRLESLKRVRSKRRKNAISLFSLHI